LQTALAFLEGLISLLFRIMFVTCDVSALVDRL